MFYLQKFNKWINISLSLTLQENFFGHSWFNTCLEETEDMGRHVICVAKQRQSAWLRSLTRQDFSPWHRNYHSNYFLSRNRITCSFSQSFLNEVRRSLAINRALLHAWLLKKYYIFGLAKFIKNKQYVLILYQCWM